MPAKNRSPRNSESRHELADAAGRHGDEQGETHIVADDLVGERLDRALVKLVPGLSRTQAQERIRAGSVLVNGRQGKPSSILESGQSLTVLAPASGQGSVAGAEAPEAEDIPLNVVYEDDDLLVIDKPAGLVVHPAPGHERGTLVNALLAHVPALETGEDPRRPGIVHRLDKDTSGLLVVAKTGPAHATLAEQMAQHSMVKRYLALVEGYLDVPEGVVEAPIGRDPRYRQRMAVTSDGRDARTRFRVLRQAKGRSLVELELETGRTHQIRVHLAAIHHPVVGDTTYGRPQKPLPPRQFLHAGHLELRHPASGEWMTFDAPLPPDLASFLETWER